MDSLVLPHVNADCMQIFLDGVASPYPENCIIMVMDGAGLHQGVTPPASLHLVRLPPYSPKLNPVEHIWDEIQEKYSLNRVFESLDALEDHLVVALNEMEHNQTRVRSIIAWPWILAVMN